MTRDERNRERLELLKAAIAVEQRRKALPSKHARSGVSGDRGRAEYRAGRVGRVR